jgi:transcriptional regulator with XRE-family HTH domain
MPKPLRPLTPDLSPAHRLGAELRTYRQKKGHSQKSLGDAVHVSNSMIGAIEAGHRISTAEVIKACDDELDAAGELCTLWFAAATSRRRPGRPAEPATAPSPTRTARSAASSPLGRALEHVERVWNVRIDRARAVRGAASIGAATDRGTWIRLECARAEQIIERSWGGAEDSVAVRGVAAPVWINTLTWRGEGPGVVWRADEIEFVREPPVGAAPVLGGDPRLSTEWWKAWNSSMDALADARTTRIAVVRRQPVTAEYVAAVVEAVWPGRVQFRVSEWACAHGDMTWRKLTSPACRILGWDGFGLAPRGLDAATLWCHSLAVPEVAARIRSERKEDLESPTGTVMALFCLARILGSPCASADPLYSLAKQEASLLLASDSQAA